VTRGEPDSEPRPVHITLIARCLSGLQTYNSVVVIRRFTPGLSPGYETRPVVELTFFLSRGAESVVPVRFSRPRSTRTGNSGPLTRTRKGRY
jgi:hypothetical protein